jgi:tetratricopeptide (TPR) repeat protein
MKNIKIFLVPSSDAVMGDMTGVRDFFRQLNEMYFDSGINFSILNANEMTENELKEHVADSDLSFFLFFEDVSDNMRSCFDIFFESFKKTDKPKIVTYFKYTESPNDMTEAVREFSQMLGNELRHYYNNYNSIDTLKLGILMQIKVMRLDASQITISDNGMICLNGQPVADTSKIPMFEFNDRLNELKSRYDELTKEWGRLRTLRMDDPNNEELYFEFSRVATERDDTKKALREFEDLLLKTSEELAAKKGEMSPRQAEAYRLLEMGDVDGACEILPLDELLEDIRRNRRFAKNATAPLETNVEELATRITALNMKGLNNDTVAEIRRIYEEIYDTFCDTRNIGWSKLNDYAAFLYNQNDYAKAIKVAEKLNWYYSDPDNKVNEYDLGRLYNLLGVLYKAQNKPKKAEKYCLDSIEIYERLVKKNADAYEPALAGSYNNVGAFYSDHGQHEKAEKYFLAAIEIRERLVKKNAAAYEPDLAGSYNNVGAFYYEQGQPEKAEKYYLDAIEIYERLVEKNADAYEPYLATSYNNVGAFYAILGQTGKAEKYYLAAIEIQERLVEKNAEAYEPALAGSYNNAGNFYSDQGQSDKAEKYYLDAIEIYERLVEKNADAYEPDLAGSYINAGNFYKKQGQLKKAEKYYLAAIEIRERLVKKNAEAYEPVLAGIYNIAGIFYKNQGQPEKAEKYYLAAMEIKERLVEKNAYAYEPDLAGSYSAAGGFYDNQGQPSKAEKYFLAAIEIYECLAKKNADAYEPDLADSYDRAGAFYFYQSQSKKAEKYYLAAMEIYERLVKRNPDAYEPALATIYISYYLLKEDKTYLDKAYEIAKRRQDNPRCKTIVEFVESH